MSQSTTITNQHGGELRQTERLAGLAGEEPDEELLASCQQAGSLVQDLATSPDRPRLPVEDGIGDRADGVVDVISGAVGDAAEQASVLRIDDGEGGGRGSPGAAPEGPLGCGPGR